MTSVFEAGPLPVEHVGSAYVLLQFFRSPAAELLASAGESSAAAALGPCEKRIFDGLTVPKRRAEWLAGRLAARRLLAEHPAAAGLRLEVLPRPDGSPQVVTQSEAGGSPAGGSPAARLTFRAPTVREGPGPDPGCQAPPLSLSISHCTAPDGGVGLAAVAVVDSPLVVGLDVELVAPRDPDFLEAYYTPDERTWAARDPLAATIAWAAKEAVFKALRTDSAREPRNVVVSAPARSERPALSERQRVEGWGHPLSVHCPASPTPLCAYFCTLRHGDSAAAADFAVVLVVGEPSSPR
jgi:phosphopantetheinyl transferase